MQLALSILLSVALATASALVQQPTPTTAPSSTDALSPQQQAIFAAARSDFGAEKWPDALAKFQTLHTQLPNNLIFSKFAAEASLNTGDTAAAIALLQPIELANPADWQARALLARSYAESGQDNRRDAELDKLLALHAASTDPQFKQLTQFLVSRIPAGGGHLDLFYSLQPWSHYDIYEMARVYNASGQQVYRITLESNDFDQPLWAKQHPDLAARGMRMFSMDGYSEPHPGPNGTSTQTHATFGFFDGRPSYNLVRDRMTTIAVGKGGPMSSTTTTQAVPKQ